MGRKMERGAKREQSKQMEKNTTLRKKWNASNLDEERECKSRKQWEVAVVGFCFRKHKVSPSVLNPFLWQNELCFEPPFIYLYSSLMQPDYTSPICNTAHSQCSHEKKKRAFKVMRKVQGWVSRQSAFIWADEKGMIRPIDLSAAPAMGDTEPIVPVFVAG